MRSALAGWAFAFLSLAVPSRPAGAVEAAPVGIQVSFKLDPRLAGATYGGERWVSPPTYSGASAQDQVDVRAQAFDASGKPVAVAFRWIPADPAMVSVTSGQDRVTIAVRRAGESKLRIVCDRGSKELVVRGLGTGAALRIEVVQPAAPVGAPPRPKTVTAARSLADVARGKREAARKNRESGDAFLTENRKRDGVVVLPSGVQYEVLTAGTGEVPEAGDTIVCHYRGTFVDGTEFVSTRRRGRPAKVKLAKVIPGFRQALRLMPVGSRWQVVVPPQLAYGARGVAGKRSAAALIGPNATLVFDVEILVAGKPLAAGARHASVVTSAPAGER